MQRIYGVCFPTPEELEEHLKLLEEAKERDHRKIGKEMGLFMTDDLVGRGPSNVPSQGIYRMAGTGELHQSKRAETGISFML